MKFIARHSVASQNQANCFIGALLARRADLNDEGEGEEMEEGEGEGDEEDYADEGSGSAGASTDSPSLFMSSFVPVTASPLGRLLFLSRTACPRLISCHATSGRLLFLSRTACPRLIACRIRSCHAKEASAVKRTTRDGRLISGCDAA